jgi:hypothetical protein
VIEVYCGGSEANGTMEAAITAAMAHSVAVDSIAAIVDTSTVYGSREVVASSSDNTADNVAVENNQINVYIYIFANRISTIKLFCNNSNGDKCLS